MAKEIQIATDTSGQTLYAQIFRVTDGQVWNTAGTPAFENYATANIADYDVALTEQGTASKIYMGTFPSAIGAGSYLVRILIRAGGSPAETDTLAGVGTIHWDGAAVVDVAAVHANLASAMGATFNTSTDSLEAIRNQGDSAWITATGFATSTNATDILADTAAILADTNELQTDWADGGRLDLILDARASQASVDALNDLSAADVNAEVDTALADINLDHLIHIAVDTDYYTTVHQNSVIGYLSSTANTFDRSTDSLEVIAGNSGATAADIADAVWDEDMASHVGAGSTGEALNSTLRAADIAGITSSVVAGIGLTIATGTIGATGNSTTALHLTGLTFGDDELNNLLLVIRDVSESEYHARWITDWADTGDLATVATLPFTPQNSTDTYVILAVRQDVTGGGGLDAAGVRAAIGLASANLDTQLGTIDSTADAILVDTAEIGAAGAGLTALASAANLATVAGYLDTEIAAILADTNELQTDWVNGGRLDLILDARASQTSVDDLPTNAELATALASADDATLAAIAALNNLSAAQVNAEVDTALADIKLDHLIHLAVDTDYNTTVHQNSVVGYLGSTGNTYDRSTDSQEALRNRGDAAWVTATGFSTHSAADVWAVATRVLTAGTNIVLAKGVGVTGFNDLSAAQVNAEVDTALADYDGPTNAEMEARTIVAANYATAANLDTVAGYLDTEIAAILEDTGTTLPAQIAALNNISAADVWAAGTRTLTAGTNIQLPVDGLANVTTWTVAITGNVTGNLSGSVGSVAGGGITSASFATGAVDADALAADAVEEIAEAILSLANGVETGYTPRQALRLILAALAGKLSGAAGTDIVIRDVNDTKDRIQATVDSVGNRTALTLDVT